LQTFYYTIYIIYGKNRLSASTKRMRLNFPKRFHNVFIPYVHGKDDLLKFTLSKNLAKIYSRYRSGNNFACIIKIIM